MTNLIIFLCLIALLAVNIQLKQLNMTFEEYSTAMQALVTQLNKALQEIIREIQNLDNVPQDLIDKLTAAQSVAQELDDLNPDAKPNP